ETSEPSARLSLDVAGFDRTTNEMFDHHRVRLAIERGQQSRRTFHGIATTTADPPQGVELVRVPGRLGEGATYEVLGQPELTLGFGQRVSPGIGDFRSFLLSRWQLPEDLGCPLGPVPLQLLVPLEDEVVVAPTRSDRRCREPDQ